MSGGGLRLSSWKERRMECELSMEQDWLLRQMKDRLANLSRAELVDLAVGMQATLFAQAENFKARLLEMGVPVEIHLVQDFDFGIPESEEELVQVFGRRPSEEEVMELTNQRIQAFQDFHGMDIDFSEIAMEEDGDS